MNYGIEVCKLKPFEPPKYRIEGAARCDMKEGPGWQVRDPATSGGSATHSSVTLASLHLAALCLSF